jgi:NitT/TauT family transport system substrate-binding protein
MLMVLPYDTVTFAPLYVADAQGFFDDEDLDLQVLYSLRGGKMGGKHQKVQLALKGEIEFFTSVSTTIEAVQRGWGDVVAVAASSERPFFALVRDDIREIADLRGKRIMTGGGASRNEMLHLIESQGWTVGEDVDLVRGGATDRMKAFEDPTVHAVAARTHYLAWARRFGFHPLTYTGGATWFEGGIGVSRSYLEREPDAVRRMVRAFARATDFVRDENNRDAVVEALAYYVTYLTPESALESYDVHRPYFSLRLDEAGLRYMAGVLAVAKGTAVSWTADHMDTTFLKELGIV